MFRFLLAIFLGPLFINARAVCAESLRLKCDNVRYEGDFFEDAEDAAVLWTKEIAGNGIDRFKRYACGTAKNQFEHWLFAAQNRCFTQGGGLVLGPRRSRVSVSGVERPIYYARIWADVKCVGSEVLQKGRLDD